MGPSIQMDIQKKRWSQDTMTQEYDPYVDHPTWQACKGCPQGDNWQSCEDCWTQKIEECTRDNKEVR